MSPLANALRDAAEAAAEEHANEKSKDEDLRAMIQGIGRGLAADRQVADDRHETLCRKLDEILKKLGTNGSGGDHG